MKKKNYSDSIILSPEDRSRYFLTPREEAFSDSNYIKHVICEGAHFHVLIYDSNGVHCSEPKCIYNKPIED